MRRSATDDRRATWRARWRSPSAGLYTTTPNPRVGCVIVSDGRIVGEGWHRRAGEAHAEVAAFADARAQGSRRAGRDALRHARAVQRYGRTPPCVDAVIACRRGARRGRDARSESGKRLGCGATARMPACKWMSDCLRAEAGELNVGFVSRMERGLPWVRSKIAASLDGRTALANGESHWITGEPARADGHAWRARACAVLTGIGTVLHDDPAAERASKCRRRGSRCASSSTGTRIRRLARACWTAAMRCW